MSYSAQCLMEILAAVSNHKPVVFFDGDKYISIDGVIERDDIVELRTGTETKEPE